MCKVFWIENVNSFALSRLLPHNPHLPLPQIRGIYDKSHDLPPPTQYFTIWSLKLCLLLSASISLSWKHSLYKPTALLLPKGSRQCWEVVTSQGDILLPWSAELASPPSPRLSYEVIHYHGFGHRVMDSAVFHANSSQMTTLSRRYRCSYYPHFVEEDTESQQS